MSGAVRADSLSPQVLAFVENLSGVAAIAIETRRLIAEQKALLEAFIQLIAAAIDAKSPYTGGHCQRVPELTKLLAQAACDAREGPFRDFALDADEWEAVHIASWLHDCGKVTTPEYVVDKATKLETICDRIHEIRMRFEVLKRDAEIAYWKGRAEGGDPETLRAALRRRARGARRRLRLRRALQRRRRVARRRRCRAIAADRHAHLAAHARRSPRRVVGGARADGPDAGGAATGRRAAARRQAGARDRAHMPASDSRPTIRGASSSTCRRTGTTAASSTTSPSDAAR